MLPALLLLVAVAVSVNQGSVVVLVDVVVALVLELTEHAAGMTMGHVIVIVGMDDRRM
jgi:hypothetical protein